MEACKTKCTDRARPCAVVACRRRVGGVLAACWRRVGVVCLPFSFACGHCGEVLGAGPCTPTHTHAHAPLMFMCMACACASHAFHILQYLSVLSHRSSPRYR